MKNTLQKRHPCGPTMILVALFFLGAALRFLGLSRYSLWYDEGGSLVFAGLVDRSFHFARSDYMNDPLLFPVLLRAWQGLCSLFFHLQPTSPASDFLLRFLPFLLSVATIPFFYLLSRRLAGHRAPALTATFLFCISPFQIYYAQELRQYAVYMFASTLMLYLLIRTLDEDRPWLWLSLTLSFVATWYSHYFSFWNIFFANLYFLLTISHHRKLFWKWVATNMVVLALCIPIIVLTIKISSIYNNITVMWSATPTWGLAILTIKALVAGYSPRAICYIPLTIILSLSALAGYWALRAKPRHLLLLFLFSLAPMIANILYWQSRSFPMYEHRLFLFFASGLFIAAAIGIHQYRSRFLLLGFLTAITLLTIPCLSDLYSQNLHSSERHRGGARYKPNNRLAADYIAKHGRPTDIVGHITHATLYPFFHYLPNGHQKMLVLSEQERQGHLASFPNPTLWENQGIMPVLASTFVGQNKRLWLVESWWEPLAPIPSSRLIRDWFDARYVRLDYQSWEGIRIYLYDLTASPFTEPSAVRFADNGYETWYSYPGHLRDTEESLRTDERTWPDPRKKMSSDVLLMFRLYDSTGTAPANATPLLTSGHEANLYAALPYPAENPIPGYAQLLNNSSSARTFVCHIYASTAMLPSLSLDNAEGDGAFWFPTLQYDPDSSGHHFNISGRTVTLTPQLPASKDLQATLDLPPGTYHTFLRHMEEGSPENLSRAHLHFYTRGIGASEGDLVNTLSPFGHLDKTQWLWSYLGDFSFTAPATLSIVANNSDNLNQAYFDIDRVAFLGVADTQNENPSILVSETEITLRPGQYKDIPLVFPVIPSRAKRLDVEVFDPVDRKYYNIFIAYRSTD